MTSPNGLDDWSSTTTNAQSANQAAQKKPRHRHAPEQLAALNELFDQNEHPPLDLRTALAERLGMETKTVNAWFQNKRASSKKRTRTAAHDQPNGSHLNTAPTSLLNSSNPATTPGDLADLDEDEYPNPAYSTASQIAASDISDSLNSSFYAGSLDHSQFISARESPDSTMPRKMRMRPTVEQTEELKKIYNVNPHPTSEERQALSERIGMRYQSITNWFQNQRSLAKRRKDDDHTDGSSSNSKSDYPHHADTRQYSAFPPPPPHNMHPSLTPSVHSLLSQPQQHVSSSVQSSSRLRRSPSISPSADEPPLRRASSRRSSTPYGGGAHSRPRRSRPEPYQLDALKGLFTRTSTPTIEERSALALEIGMDVGKVTNWFRNLRQTARKRNNRNGALGSGDDDDNDPEDSPPYSSLSRDGTPSLSARSSSSSSSSMMELDHDHDHDVRMRNEVLNSNVPSEDEEYPEAITPETGRSPSPGPSGVYSKPSRHGAPSHMPIYDRYAPTHAYAPRPHYHHPHPVYSPAPHHYSHPRFGLGNNDKALMHESSGGSGIVLDRFSASVAIYDSSSYYPQSKLHPSYRHEDPTSCAQTAKKFGIDLEDAYLLLDFHRQ